MVEGPLFGQIVPLGVVKVVATNTNIGFDKSETKQEMCNPDK